MVCMLDADNEPFPERASTATPASYLKADYKQARMCAFSSFMTCVCVNFHVFRAKNARNPAILLCNHYVAIGKLITNRRLCVCFLHWGAISGYFWPLFGLFWLALEIDG
jgi:hypothetical protein